MPSVAIDCFHEYLPAVEEGSSIVTVDVIRATTTAVTAVAAGRRCFPARSIEAAVPLAARLDRPLLAGELGGRQPYGFEAQNSPAELARRDDVERPLILLSTSGTPLMDHAARTHRTYVACMRNHTAVAEHLSARGETVMLLGAASRGEFREEDQLCCALIASALLDAGYDAASSQTESLVERWREAPMEAIEAGHSAEYLRRTGQEHDLKFVLSHVDDIDDVFRMEEGEVVR
jgi:2-phosphosulfolactate phosphatase